jgi:alkanesulfonate monooxygenase SsuD/methylene tetrahydromethanopterin reductase-like flavin-dependent oxidoreductase (luciferase family)
MTAEQSAHRIVSRPALGVIFHPSFPPESLAGYARRAEAAGFDELWLWDDCFVPGALTSAAIALSATQKLKVGIGLIPATSINPLFAAMELTTLARAFPGRILPGFGHGLASWMAQIGAAPTSSLKSLGETVPAIRRLLSGEKVTLQGEQVKLDKVQMHMPVQQVPPLYVGAMREKTLRLAGRIGDGTILAAMSSPAYIRWARQHIHAGMAEAGRTQQHVVVYLNVKVSPDGITARAAARRALAEWWPWVDAHTDALGITQAAHAFVQQHGVEGLAEHMPDEWLDELCAAGTPDQALDLIQRTLDAGADSLVLQPLNGDPACLDEYIQFLLPRLKLA